MSTSSHPAHEQLAAYVRAELPEPVEEAVADHLEQCRRCEDTVSGLEREAGTFFGRLPDSRGPEPFVDEPQCGEALERIRAEGLRPSELPATELFGGSPSPVSPVMTQLREYRILERLGAGGMGTVYKALHTKLDKLVALKVLPAAAMQDAELVARFEREMKAVGKLEHPNIVRAMDAGCHEGTHFLVMEYVDGLDLAKIVKRCGRLRIADACEVVRQAALALRHADEHALVHRDVKPPNLVLSRDGEVKILDLGLALLQKERQPGDESTGAGRAMGTLDYMAPEQVRDSHSVDIRADIYGLGCTLYKLLAGHAPFSGSKYESTFDKMMAHLNDPVPPIRQARPDVPEKLSAVLDRMLAKDRDARYTKPGQVVEDLKPFCAGHDLAGLLARAEKGIGPEAVPPAPAAGPKPAGRPSPSAVLATPPKTPTARSPESPARPPERRSPGRPDGRREGGVGRPAPSAGEAQEAAFDPYYKWLGIPPDEQPPNHYRLLGIRIFEEDRDVIQVAAERQASHLKTRGLGKHSLLSQKLLNEVHQAKICLLTPEEKAAYDAALRREVETPAQGPSGPATPAVPAALPDDREPSGRLSAAVPSATVARPARRRPLAMLSRVLRRVPRYGWIAAGVAGVLMLALGVMISIRTTYGTVKIELPESAFDTDSEVEIKLDGETIDIAGLEKPLRLRVGEHNFEVTFGGLTTYTKSFPVRRGEQEPVRISFETEESSENEMDEGFLPDSNAAPGIAEGDNVASMGKGGGAPFGASSAPGTSSTQPGGFALFFDGKKAHVNIPYDYTAKSPLTVEVSVTPFPRGWQAQSVFSCRGGSDNGLSLQMMPLGYWMFALTGRPKSRSQTAAASYQRVHVAGVFDRQRSWLFVDGKRQGEPVRCTFKPAHHYFYLGADPDYPNKVGNGFHGLIHQVRISTAVRYQEDFTPAEVLLPDKDTVLLYRFDQPTFRRAVDLSGNRLDGAIKGGARWVNAEEFVKASRPPEVASATPSNAPLRYVGYAVCGPPAVLDEIAPYTNLVIDDGWLEKGSGVVAKARQQGLKVVLRFFANDREGIEAKLSPLLAQYRDVIVGVAWQNPFAAGHSAEEVDQFASKLKADYPGLQFWMITLSRRLGVEPDLPVPAGVDVVVALDIGSDTPDAVRQATDEYLPAWLKKAQGRPVLLFWANWALDGKADPNRCAAGTVRACFDAVRKHGLAGVVFGRYGPEGSGPNAATAGIETNKALVQEIRECAKEFGFSKGAPSASPTTTTQALRPAAASEVIASAKASDDPDRRAAEWVIGLGSWVNVEGRGGQQIRSVGDLPDGKFYVTSVYLYLNRKVTNDGLANLRGLTRLKFLSLCGIPLQPGWQDVINLRQMTTLERLDLASTKVDPAVMEHIEPLTDLSMLLLTYGAIGDADLQRLRNHAKLDWLSLIKTNVTDAGLEHLRGLTKLRRLELKATQVTDAGIAKLQAALPGCKIER